MTAQFLSDGSASHPQAAPLAGLKVLEFRGIGPAPFAAMVLAGLGADVLRLGRPDRERALDLPGAEADLRWRPELSVDLKDPRGSALALRLADAADALIEGFRPGVMERLGLGPDILLERNPRIVYGRVTGYGQQGPLATVAGHDINYLAVSGILGTIARDGERPLFPLNLLGDYGGGGMLLALGIVAAVLHARQTGSGQVVDAAMIDGVAQLATLVFGLHGAGSWGRPGTNLLDSGAPFYEVYETADGGFMAVGAIEPRFYSELLRHLGIEADDAPQWERSRWSEMKRRFAAAFRSRTRAQWTDVFETAEACVTPVLTLREALEHRHNRVRGTFGSASALPRPAPRFSQSAVDCPRTDPDLATTLERWGLRQEDWRAV